MTPTQLRERAKKAWWRSLEARVLGEPFFPWEVALPRISSRTDEYDAVVQQSDLLIAGSKEKLGYGYSLVSETRKLRLWGQNAIPTRIIFHSAEDLDAYLGMEEQSATFERISAEISERFPTLRLWTARHAEKVLKNEGKWADLLTVCDYFVSTPKPGVYLRELPLPLHTKFIEENRGVLRLLLDQLLPASELGGGGFEMRFGLRVPEVFVRVRFLDPDLRQRLGFPFEQAGIARADFAQLPLAGVNLIVTENEITFLTLPLLPNSIGVWGSGFAVTALGELPVLRDANVFYWGDLDAQGFEILSLLRERNPTAKTLLMDRSTWEKFRSFAVAGTPSRNPSVDHLSREEADLYEELKEGNRRLEQERVGHEWASERISRALLDQSKTLMR